jgi:PAS domain S-box-containing protein
MSELIKNDSSHLDSLFEFASELVEGKDGRRLIEDHKTDIDTVTPYDAMFVLDRLLTSGYSIEKVKANTGKIINVFFKSLDSFTWEKPGEGHFLYYLMLENREAEKIIQQMRLIIKELYHGSDPDKEMLLSGLHKLLDKLAEYELHYIKKENILFPCIEKAFPHFRCLQLMWSFHDDFRKSLKTLKKIINDKPADLSTLSKELGKLFFVVLPIIFREEQIVFPVALKALPEAIWQEMLEQSLDDGWCYIKPPDINRVMSDNVSFGSLVDLKSGLLNPEQITMLLNNLPVDITFVDENDQVVYFSSGTHRIFPRSKAIIGRKVQNCHPPDSVHIVNEIVDSFRKGIKNEAEFWINRKGRFIHIRYFALRNEQQEYKGVIEVSQDVTAIRSLEGERRLLDW